MPVLLIGNGYMPYRTAGEKNFFYQLVPLLHGKLDGLAVLSINDQRGTVSQPTPDGAVTIYQVPRAFHPYRPERYHGFLRGLPHYHHRHRSLREALEKQVTLLRSLPLLQKIVSQKSIDHLHFLENFGPAMGWVQRLLNRPVTVSAINYQPRGLLYDRYLQQSFLPLTGIAAYSEAYASILRRLGLQKQQIQVIRWGVPQPASPLSATERASLRQLYQIPPEAIFFLWTGYLMQIQRYDLEQTLHLAHRVAASEKRAFFLFCLKPEIYRQLILSSGTAWLRFHGLRLLQGSAYPEDLFFSSRRVCAAPPPLPPGSAPPEGVFSSDTGQVRLVCGGADFPQLLGAADFLLSPVFALHSTVAPPLTWIEAMTQGIPLITTNVPGASELIQHYRSGFLAPTPNQLPSLLLALAAQKIPRPLPAHVQQDAAPYNIQYSLQGYLQLFQQQHQSDDTSPSPLH